MLNDSIETRAHTAKDGTLKLTVNVGLPDADVDVSIHVTPVTPSSADENGWPNGFFERVAGSMPELRRAPQGDYEQRSSLE